METDSKGLRGGVEPLSSYADVIALAVIALILGVIGVEGCCFL